MTNNFQWFIPVLTLALGSCSANPPTFISYTQQKGISGRKAGVAFDPGLAPIRTDALALNYANAIEVMFRATANGAHITRAGSDVGLAGLSGAIGAAETLSIGAAGVSSMGLASGGIVALRAIFDTKGRTTVYSEAAERIHAAIKDYVAHNLNHISEEHLTPNGWTLVNVVQSNIDIVNKILNGQLPKPQMLAQASEAMSVTGATRQTRGGTPVNNIPASSLTSAVGAIQKRQGVTTQEHIHVQDDRKYLDSVRELKGRINILTDAEALAAHKAMLGWDVEDAKGARFDIVEAIDLLKQTNSPARVSDWDRVLPKKSDYQQLISVLFEKAGKLTDSAAIGIAQSQLNKTVTTGEQARVAIKAAMINLKRTPNPGKAKEWEAVLKESEKAPGQ